MHGVGYTAFDVRRLMNSATTRMCRGSVPNAPNETPYFKRPTSNASHQTPHIKRPISNAPYHTPLEAPKALNSCFPLYHDEYCAIAGCSPPEKQHSGAHQC